MTQSKIIPLKDWNDAYVHGVDARGIADGAWAAAQPKLKPITKPELVVMCAADIKPEKVEWLWRQRLPLGKCVSLLGKAGSGNPWCCMDRRDGKPRR